MTVTSKHKRGCDNSDMFVRTSDDNEPKRLCCPFCDKPYPKLSRHMRQKHKSEPDVEKFLSFQIGNVAEQLMSDCTIDVREDRNV